jgi:hypothetical protein
MRRGWSRGAHADAEGRADPDRDRAPDQREHREREVIEVAGAGEIDAEGAGAAQPGQAVIAAGHAGPAIGDAPQNLAESERDHQEAQARGAQRDQAEDGGLRGAGRERRGGRLQVAPVQVQHQPAADIGGQAEVAGVPERGQAGIADQQVQAEREQRRDQHLAGHVDEIVAAGDRGHAGQHGDEQGKGNALHAEILPNSPRGRMARITTIGRNRMM